MKIEDHTTGSIWLDLAGKRRKEREDESMAEFIKRVNKEGGR